MNFVIGRNTETGIWNITPDEGALAGVVVATAEGVSLQDVVFDACTVVGTIKAVWGLAIQVEALYNDRDTLRALHLGKSFCEYPSEALNVDFDGFVDRANRLCRGAKRLIVIGTNIFAGGVK